MAEAHATKSSEGKSAEQVHQRPAELGPQPAGGGSCGAVLALQRSAGNQAVIRLLRSATDHPPLPGALLQRKCKTCASGNGTCSRCKEEQTLQRKSEGGAAASPYSSSVPAAVQNVLGNGNGQPLEQATRALMESRFNHDFSNVRIHNYGTGHTAAASINAAAFTVGNSIWFGQGQYRPQTDRGLFLLAHELAHTIQQRGQSSSVHRSLLIGGAHDPSESAADQAAAAVLQNDEIPYLGEGRPVLRRAPLPFDPRIDPSQIVPQITPTEDPDAVSVRYQNNTYRVRRRVTGWREECETVETNEPARLSADFDRTNAWAQVEWCTTGSRSMRGRIRFGADIPAALQRTITNLVNRGQDPRDVLRNLDLTPFIEVDIARSEQVRVRARGEVTVRPGAEEVRGGRGTVSIETPRATIEFELFANPPSGAGGQPELGGGVRVVIPFGRRPQPVQCRRTEVCRFIPQFTLGCVRRIPETQVPRQAERSLYFEYATDVIATRNSSTGRNRRAENNRGADQNDQEIQRIRQLLDEGWQVSSIRGFTSPEGPRNQRRENRFIGNDELSRRRAAAAQSFIEGLCNPGGALTMRRRTCFVSNAPVVGEGERFTADNPRTGRELEGPPLAEQATPRFLESEEEASRRTPELEEQLRTAGPRQQGSLIYPLLRRATIALTRMETIPARDEELDSCPPDVEREVRTFFEAQQRRRRNR